MSWRQSSGELSSACQMSVTFDHRECVPTPTESTFDWRVATEDYQEPKIRIHPTEREACFYGVNIPSYQRGRRSRNTATIENAVLRGESKGTPRQTRASTRNIYRTCLF